MGYLKDEALEQDFEDYKERALMSLEELHNSVRDDNLLALSQDVEDLFNENKHEANKAEKWLVMASFVAALIVDHPAGERVAHMLFNIILGRMLKLNKEGTPNA